ncbi:MAG: recombination protein O N-terminal domain-containing protein [Candidatus Paceibacteria bacterium]
MSYQTYITEAIVCGSYDNNTADKSFLLFTRRGGMLYATARSVREERSKQRYALQVFSCINISLVRGKQSWRIGSVESTGNLFSQAQSRAVRGSIVSVMKLVRQYIHGEETNFALYDEVVEGLSFLISLPENSKVVVWETFIKARILYQLGYIAPSTEVKELFYKDLHEVLEEDIVSFQKTFSKLIEEAKAVSHLVQG